METRHFDTSNYSEKFKSNKWAITISAENDKNCATKALFAIFARRCFPNIEFVHYSIY